MRYLRQNAVSFLRGIFIFIMLELYNRLASRSSNPALGRVLLHPARVESTAWRGVFGTTRPLRAAGLRSARKGIIGGAPKGDCMAEATPCDQRECRREDAEGAGGSHRVPRYYMLCTVGRIGRMFFPPISRPTIDGAVLYSALVSICPSRRTLRATRPPEDFILFRLCFYTVSTPLPQTWT